MKAFYFFIFSFIFISCNLKPDTSIENTDGTVTSLTKIWETDTLLTCNESVIYDAGTDAIYVSCMGNPDDIVDGDGFVTKLNLDGEIINLHWVSGLNSPKGLAIYNNVLLVIDINQLVKVDLATAKVLSKEAITVGNFFNDMDVAQNGDVFLTESHTNEIIRHRNGQSEIYYSFAEIGGLNGIHVSGDKLLFTGSNGNIYTLSKNLDPKVLADSCFNPDGIESYYNGYFCSSWQGKIYYFNKGGNTLKLVDTWANNTYSADIDVIENKKLLLSPTLFNNKVIAYEIRE